MALNLEQLIEQFLAEQAARTAELSQIPKPIGLDITKPEVQQRLGAIMDSLLAGQKNQLDDYVRRAALTGVQRGGYNVRGIPNYAGSLERESINALAANYLNRLDTALALLGEQNAQEQAMWATAQNLIGSGGAGGGAGGSSLLSILQKEMESQRALQEAEKQRQWETSERLGSQQWKSQESSAERDWQSAENTAQRNWQSEENSAERELKKWLQESQQNWQSEENRAQRTWESGESARQRSWQSGESAAQRSWQSGESAAQRTWQTGERTAQGAFQERMAKFQREWEAAEAEKDRALQRYLQQQLLNTGGGGGGGAGGGGGFGSSRPDDSNPWTAYDSSRNASSRAGLFGRVPGGNLTPWRSTGYTGGGAPYQGGGLYEYKAVGSPAWQEEMRAYGMPESEIAEISGDWERYGTTYGMPWHDIGIQSGWYGSGYYNADNNRYYPGENWYDIGVPSGWYGSGYYDAGSGSYHGGESWYDIPSYSGGSSNGGLSFDIW